MLFSFLILVPLISAAPQVQLGNTTVIGSDIPGLSLEFFGDIPFAEVPTGALRFSPPVPTELPSGFFDATNFGNSCLQMGMSADRMSENCLSANIFRPSGLPCNASLPVMFWTHGGGFDSGGATPYNASAIVAQSVWRGTPIIFVSGQYRLGPLGFPQGSEAFQRGSLNLGIRDQIACLQWVQLFIKAFGGDPSKVTVFGQSAGAIMTAILFLGDDIAHLARAAIFESGYAATSAIFPADRGESDWQNFVGGIPSCSALQNTSNTFGCLQGVDSTEILSGWSAAAARTQVLFPWTPALDGRTGLLPTLPSIMWENGNFSCLPFIAGTNMDEGTIFTPHHAFDGKIIDQLIIANFSPPPPFNSCSDLKVAAQTIVNLYPNDPALGSPFNTGNETFGLPPQFKRAAAIEGDISFQSQRRLWSQTAASLGVKVFAYLFTQPQTPPSLGVYHGSEVRFVYGGVGSAPSSDRILSRMMIDYWTSFATSLDPNDGLGFPRPLWTPYTSDNPSLIQLNGDNTTMIPDDYRTNEIQYIMNISEILHH
ncbi:esterase 1 [Mycena capillaripes]|nr:esterase 1 [Mycena capillaripes]